MIKYIVFIFAVMMTAGCDTRDYTQAPPQNIAPTAAVIAPKESKEVYIASTAKIGRKGEKIYYKEYLKNPDNFIGKRLNLTGKILEIDESGGSAIIQLLITERNDTVIVYYPGKTSFYRDDWITVYGEGIAAQEGKTVMGASAKWPLINAAYIKKRAAGD